MRNSGESILSRAFRFKLFDDIEAVFNERHGVRISLLPREYDMGSEWSSSEKTAFHISFLRLCDTADAATHLISADLLDQHK